MGVKTLTKSEIRRLDMMNQREEIVPQCKKYGDKEESCKRIDPDGIHCSAYIKPVVMWKLGPCVLSTHVIAMETKAQEKLRVGQQKTRRKKKNK
jgi:hypothetical protein